MGQGVSAHLITGDRWIRAIFLSPVVWKDRNPHSALSVNKGCASTNPLYVMILQHWKVIRVMKGCRIRPSRWGEQSDLHVQVLPLVPRNTVKTFAFDLSSELKLSVTKAIFTSCSSNAHPEFSNSHSVTKVVKLLYLKHPFRMFSATSAAFREMYPCNHQPVDHLPFTVSSSSSSLPKQKVHKKTLVLGSSLSI